MLWGDWRVCTFEALCLPLDKISCTRQFESKLSLRSFAKSLAKRIFFENLLSMVFTTPSIPPVLGDRNPQKREDVTALLCYFCPTCPSPAGGSLTHSQALALSKRARDVTAPSRCSEPLRSKVGGPSKVFAMLCGLGPHGDKGFA